MRATAWGAVPVRMFCPMLRAAAFLSLLLVAAAAAGAGISGVASVTDGDTLRLGAERIRLAVCRVDGADVNAWMVEQGWQSRTGSTRRITPHTRPQRRRPAGAYGGASSSCRRACAVGSGSRPRRRAARAIAASRGTSAGRARASTTCRAGVVRQDAHRHGEGRAVVLHRGEGPGGGVAAGEAVNNSRWCRSDQDAGTCRTVVSSAPARVTHL